MAKKKAKAKAKTKTKTKRKAAAPKKKKTAGKRGGGLTQMSYTVSPELAAVIGVKKSTRPQIVKKLWVYIKAHKCQDTKDKRLIIPDKKLEEVFGSKRPVHMLKLAGLLNKHIE